MVKFLPAFLILIIIFFYGCQTQPPVAPGGPSYVAGKIYVTYNIDFNSPSENINRVVLLEDFSNVSCNPCVISDQIIERFAEQTFGPSKLSVVKFAINWPKLEDPFYLANKPTSDYLIGFYHITSAPTVKIDGIKEPAGTDSIAIKNDINSRLQVAPPASIIVSHSFIDSAYVVNVSIKFFNNASLNFNNLVLQTAVTQKEVVFAKPPGSNGETKFYYVMRTMLPSYNGIALDTVNQNGSVVLNEEGNVLSTWDVSKLNTVVFIQDQSTKEIYQSGSTY